MWESEKSKGRFNDFTQFIVRLRLNCSKKCYYICWNFGTRLQSENLLAIFGSTASVFLPTTKGDKKTLPCWNVYLHISFLLVVLSFGSWISSRHMRAGNEMQIQSNYPTISSLLGRKKAAGARLRIFYSLPQRRKIICAPLAEKPEWILEKALTT